MARKFSKPEPARETAPRLGMIATGAALAWAAFNEPAELSAQSAITWSFGTIAIALLARAALALAIPILKLFGTQWRNAVAQLRGMPKS